MCYLGQVYFYNYKSRANFLQQGLFICRFWMVNWEIQRNNHPLNLRNLKMDFCCAEVPHQTRPITVPNTHTIEKKKIDFRSTVKITKKSIKSTTTSVVLRLYPKALNHLFQILRPPSPPTVRRPHIQTSPDPNHLPSKRFQRRSCKQKNETENLRLRSERRRLRWRHTRSIKKLLQVCPSCTWKTDIPRGVDYWDRKVLHLWRRPRLVRFRRVGPPYLIFGTSRWIIYR